MTMNIDWGKQPEGFPLWLEGTNEDHRKHSGWYRRVGQVFEGAHGGQWRAVREGQFFTVHCKPESTTWSGEGLPPVGTVCEWHPNVHGWVEVTILGHDGEDTWYRVKGEDHTQTCRNMAFFRPIRTPEQIAAEERDRTILQMALESGWPVDSELKSLPACFGILYDAGYRKQVQS